MFNFHDYERDCRIEIIDVNNETDTVRYRVEGENKYRKRRLQRIAYWFSSDYSDDGMKWNLLSSEAHDDWWEKGGY